MPLSPYRSNVDAPSDPIRLPEVLVTLEKEHIRLPIRVPAFLPQCRMGSRKDSLQNGNYLGLIFGH